MSLILNRYPITYRTEVIERLMPAIQHGNTVAIVGLAGVGKSNLIRFLQQPEVLHYYLPATYANRTHFVHLHCLPGDQQGDHIYGLFSQSLIELSLRLGLTPPVLSKTLVPYQQLRVVLNYLCQQHNQRVVLVLDEFEALLRHQSSDFLEAMRSLRDEQRTTSNLVYITITHILPQLVHREHPIKSGKFFELIKEQIFPLPAYSQADSESMLDALLVQKQLPTNRLDSVTRQNLYALTGGHGGLLKAVFESMYPSFSLSRLDGRRLVAQNSTVRGACEHIWQHLHVDEQRALVQVAHGGLLPASMEAYLVRRGLLVKDSPARLFSQLFAFHVAEQDIS